MLLDPCVQAKTAVGSIHLDAANKLHLHTSFRFQLCQRAIYELVGGWYDEACPKIARHLAPHGCVVGVQSNNETCYLFHDQTYATDYSETRWRSHRARLAARYGDIEGYKQGIRHVVRGIDDVAPPRDCEIKERADLPSTFDWVEYKEYQIILCCFALCSHVAGAQDRGCADLPRYRFSAAPLDAAGMEATRM